MKNGNWCPKQAGCEISASDSIYIIDDYIDVKTLQLLKCIKENINVIIITDNKGKNNLNKNQKTKLYKNTAENICS